MIVDDSPELTHAIKHHLERMANFEVCEVNRSTTAVQRGREFRPDLVILDMMMPDLDGGDVAALMREDTLLRNTPIIFFTSIVSNSETHGHEAHLGAYDYLAKPVEMSELIEVINRHLKT